MGKFPHCFQWKYFFWEIEMVFWEIKPEFLENLNFPEKKIWRTENSNFWKLGNSTVPDYVKQKHFSTVKSYCVEFSCRTSIVELPCRTDIEVVATDRFQFIFPG